MLIAILVVICIVFVNACVFGIPGVPDGFFKKEWQHFRKNGFGRGRRERIRYDQSQIHIMELEEELGIGQDKPKPRDQDVFRDLAYKLQADIDLLRKENLLLKKQADRMEIRTIRNPSTNSYDVAYYDKALEIAYRYEFTERELVAMPREKYNIWVEQFNRPILTKDYNYV